MELLEVGPVEAEEHPSGASDDRQPDAAEEAEAEMGEEADEREAELADDDSDSDDEIGDGDDSDDSDTEPAVMCDAGPPLTDSQIGVGASVAVPSSSTTRADAEKKKKRRLGRRDSRAGRLTGARTLLITGKEGW